MATLVLTSSGFDAAPIAGVLRDHGIDAAPATLPPGPVKLRAPSATCALILPAAGVVALGERVADLRAAMGPLGRLLVCAQQLTPRDRDVLFACGASEILAPRSRAPADVAERLLGALIASGDVAPVALGALRGATIEMRRLYDNIGTIAALSEPALVVGETGTGKELVAGELHRTSRRAGPCVPINCAALTPELLESELFGHEKGAFSGALQSRRGLLAEAGKGTVFLDEIGDLAPSAQAKLLRVLEERRARAVGSNAFHTVDARVVLATNVDLEAACNSGRFRRDLYERIAGFTLVTPPLRERRADIPLLVEHFLAQFDLAYGGRRKVPDGALDRLFEHDWPGNVRELKQSVFRAAAYAGAADGAISALKLHESLRRRVDRAPRHVVAFDPSADTWRDVHDRTRDRYFREILAGTGNNKDAAAKRAGLSRSQFYEVLKQIGAADPKEPSEA